MGFAPLGSGTRTNTQCCTPQSLEHSAVPCCGSTASWCIVVALAVLCVLRPACLDLDGCDTWTAEVPCPETQPQRGLGGAALLFPASLYTWCMTRPGCQAEAPGHMMLRRPPIVLLVSCETQRLRPPASVHVLGMRMRA